MDEDETIPDGVLPPLPGHQREHLNRGAPRYQFRTGLSPWGAYFFGLVFLVVGLAMVGLAADWFEIDESSRDAPDAVILLVGVIFSLVGFMVVWKGFSEARRLKVIANHAALYPNEPAMQDHPWDRSAFTPPRWKSAFTAIGSFLFMATFLSVFNWLAWFHEDTPIVLKAVTVFFDGILVLVMLNAIRQLIRAVRFGDCRMHYPRFPIHPGEEVTLRFTLPNGIHELRHATFRLRCLQEYTITRRTSRSTSNTPMQDQIYLEEQQLEGDAITSAPRDLEATFQLPADAPPSHLHGAQPVAWEVELELEVPGVNPQYQFLLPVY